MCPPADTEGVARSEAVRMWLLGGFRVSVGSRTVDEGAWRLRKAASLVKLLALAPGHRLHREQAMDLLWPDLGRRAASNNLRQVVHAARRTLTPTEGSRYLVSEEESLVLCPGGNLLVDVEAFEEAAQRARRSRDPAAYRATLDLYAGELLPEDRYEEWAVERREEVWRLHIALLIELAELYAERAEYGRAVETLQRALSEEPANEEAHASLMRLYALSGRPTASCAARRGGWRPRAPCSSGPTTACTSTSPRTCSSPVSTRCSIPLRDGCATRTRGTTSPTRRRWTGSQSFAPPECRSAPCPV
jgi:DNA-binding SARP family transcriptional activator